LIKQALCKINAYNSLISNVEEVRKQAFSWESNDNKQKLVELWEGLTNEKLEFKISKRWQDIGFQGNDPATDFR